MTLCEVDQSTCGEEYDAGDQMYYVQTSGTIKFPQLVRKHISSPQVGTWHATPAPRRRLRTLLVRIGSTCRRRRLSSDRAWGCHVSPIRPLRGLDVRYEDFRTA